jgi:CheY-like chemotaxis protein
MTWAYKNVNIAQLRELLNHLNDPSHARDPSVLQELGLYGTASPADVRRALTHLVDNLRPPVDVPEDSLARRFYRLLTMRYFDEVTQFEVADALGVSVRHLARLQNDALQLLVEQINRGAMPQIVDDGVLSGIAPHMTQVEREVNSLYRETLAAEHDLVDIVQSAARLVLPLALEKGIILTVDAPPNPCIVVAPKAAVSQAVLLAITYAVKGMSEGHVRIAIDCRAEDIRARIVASPHAGPCPREPWLVQELLEPVSGRAECQHYKQTLELTVTLTVSPKVRVLVIDDNRDMLRLYRRCVIGTPFEIIELNDGSVALERARSDSPDIIVLDLMLPNVDGWELLTQLANDPTTRRIPLVVCSVVDETELALSLGATASIVKPVGRQSFRAALYGALQTVEAKSH